MLGHANLKFCIADPTPPHFSQPTWIQDKTAVQDSTKSPLIKVGSHELQSNENSFWYHTQRYRYLYMHKLPWYWFYPIHPPTPLSSSVEVPAIQNFKLECPYCYSIISISSVADAQHHIQHHIRRGTTHIELGIHSIDERTRILKGQPSRVI